MKRFRTVLAMILAVSLIASIVAITAAEVAIEEEWQADIRKLMDESYAPKTTVISVDRKLAEDVEVQTHSYTIEKINPENTALQVALKLQAEGVSFSEKDWEAVDAWLEELIPTVLADVEADSEVIAKAISKEISSARRQAKPDENGELPAWANKSLYVTETAVTIPYYPELSNGVNGSATQKLQEKLILLGYLDDKADGYFGNKTKVAVEQLEAYIRELEQDVIDALPTPEPTATPEPTPMPTASASEAPADEAVATPEPTPEPTPVPLPTPVTPVDGIADGMLLAYLYSDDFVPARKQLQLDDQGDAVVRLQRRLIQLGCMLGTADGIYGGNTARSVRIFQHFNNLEKTGVADVELQKLLFSENAVAPENPMMTIGSTGEAVEKLQLRLRVLGFLNAPVDGTFGNSTKVGVETLQRYMRELEAEAIQASQTAAVKPAETALPSGSEEPTVAPKEEEPVDVSELLTIEVNGIADPILMEDFYSDRFPAIPKAMEEGSSGRDVVRVQRRLNTLEYYYSSLDGKYGSGTIEAITAFQKRNELEQTGIADEKTLSVLFSEDALKALKPYVLKISIDDQRVYAYGLDENNEHTVLVRTMKCSTGRSGTPTPKGTFQNGTSPGARWHYFKKFKCWAQYAYYVEGDIMLHSVLYGQKNGAVTRSSVNNLGSKASHGCIRLSVEDAKWVYQHCPQNTKIIVY